MNKKDVINKLMEKLNYDEEKCVVINNIIEDTFLVGKTNKEKMIQRFISEINVSKDEANKIYDIVFDVIGSGIKDKLKHPFKSKD